MGQEARATTEQCNFFLIGWATRPQLVMHAANGLQSQNCS